MTKVFISLPMNGKSDEEIKRRIEEIKSILGKAFDDFEVINSFIEEVPENVTPMWYLGKSIEILSEADAAFFADGWEYSRGCCLEHQACEEYGIQICYVRKDQSIIPQWKPRKSESGIYVEDVLYVTNPELPVYQFGLEYGVKRLKFIFGFENDAMVIDRNGLIDLLGVFFEPEDEKGRIKMTVEFKHKHSALTIYGEDQGNIPRLWKNPDSEGVIFCPAVQGFAKAENKEKVKEILQSQGSLLCTAYTQMLNEVLERFFLGDRFFLPMHRIAEEALVLLGMADREDVDPDTARELIY